MKKCKYCGSEEGYFTKEAARGTIMTFYDFDGNYRNNSNLYDGIMGYGGKYAYCIDCEKKLFEIDKERAK